MLQLLKPAHLEPVLRYKRSHRNEKPAHHNEECAYGGKKYSAVYTERTHSNPVMKETQLESPAQTSLVAQWLRIRLPMQGTQVRALVREDPTCRRATKHVRHNY
ncbi:hypothetical protein J1605_021138 [Eschrichtius robustus]|uniref:Uncharacterized protein n=1 Tax=Eschrichtius robustus TaxID=9764 RepID=A0AB34HIV2_ESCRO|nr:hypothetical protein J1605_021138 [Eschrichtius robustus]